MAFMARSIRLTQRPRSEEAALAGVAALSTPERTVRTCMVCGSREVHTDEVELHGRVLLAECPHCDHRWTRPLPEGGAREAATVRPIVRRVPEVASAA